jgi:predicted nicotinamide N-methyase
VSQTTMHVREELAAAIQQFASGQRSAAVERFAAAAKTRPGALPLANPAEVGSALDAMRREDPGNLTLRLAYAESIAETPQAADLFLSIIRQARPQDRFAALSVDPAPFRLPSVNAHVWHSIDLGKHFIEGRRKTSRVLAAETLRMHWPDLAGKTVLDIGTFGGWFAFEAERRGAQEVTALEYYSWVTDFKRINEWVAAERAAGRAANAYQPPADCFDRDAQPGRIAFDLTRSVLGSRVKPMLARMEDADIPEADIVFLLGVLYHNENPYQLLQQVARATKERLII